MYMLIMVICCVKLNLFARHLLLIVDLTFVVLHIVEVICSFKLKNTVKNNSCKPPSIRIKYFPTHSN